MAQEKAVTPDPQRPFVAIWQQDGGSAPGANIPYLRVAIWNDGRILFAPDPEKWSDVLREGRIPPERITLLKKELIDTGVFALNNATYLVPDGGTLCLMLDIDGRTQILRWDEREHPNYGINIDPKPRHIKFKECWKAVNRLALAARPAESHEFVGKFRPAESWNLRPAIQSR